MTTKSYSRTSTIGGGGATLFEYRNSSGTNTPAAIRKQGKLSENSYTLDLRMTYNGPIEMSFIGTSNMLHATGGMTIARPPTPSNIQAYARLLDKYKQSDFNLAVTAGESREAWHMIADRMFKFGAALREMRHGNVKSALRALGTTKRASRGAQRKFDSGDISGSFLELHYGWAPLLNDIYSAAQVMNKPYVPPPSIRTSTHTKGDPWKASYASMQPYVDPGENELSIYHICRLSTREISWAARLGLLNPLTVAWELTTLSFVADWFLPIGKMIQALEAIYVIPVGTYIRTDLWKNQSTMTVPAGVFCQNIGRTSVGSGLLRNKSVQMTRLVSLSIPNEVYPNNSTPRGSMIDLDLSLSQASSAAALLHQAFRAVVGKRS